MTRTVVSALLVIAGCSGDVAQELIDAGVDADQNVLTCNQAASHSDLAWIRTNVLTPSCTHSTCHNASDPASGQVDLRPGQAHDHLVGVTSHVDNARKIVVPEYPARSYMLVLIGQLAPQDASPPAGPIPMDVGTMPQGTAGALLCLQKRQAIERWIINGAQP